MLVQVQFSIICRGFRNVRYDTLGKNEVYMFIRRKNVEESST